MIHLVTYSADNMTESRKVCVQAAKENGAGMVHDLDKSIIDNEFYFDNYDTLTAQRGIGFWLWKPYIINKIMRGYCTEGDYLIYVDAGCKLISNVNEIISRMDQDIFLFSNGHQHVHWCKMDVLETIIPASEYLRDSVWQNNATHQQVQASVIFIRVTEKSRRFIKEWLLWCQFPGFIDDSKSTFSNHPEFAQHRYDQAILTCLQIKYGYKLHWWADSRWYESQRYRWPEDTYPAMFDHHRFRNKGSGTGDVEWP